MTPFASPRIDERYLMRILREMIRIDSTLPGEEPLAAFLAEELRGLGVDPEWSEVAPGRPNVYASIPLGAPGPFLVLSGHSDTVPAAEGWTSDPLEPTISDGRLYGLGAINMKAGLACLLAAFRALVEDEPARRLAGRLGFAVTVDQEGHSLGARALLGTEYGRCDAMIHAEHFHGSSPDDYLPSAGTGKVLYGVEVRGVAAHAFRPHRGGVNAVVDAARLIAALDDLPLQDHPEFGRGTVCALKVEGGYKEYAAVVPERCEIVITRLLTPGETIESAVDDLRALADRLHLASRVAIEPRSPCYESYTLDLGSPIVAAFRSAYVDVRGAKPHFAPHRGITDANVFAAEGGIPTVVFGPRGADHHMAGEHVELDSLVPTATICAETALRFLGRGG